MITIVMAYWLQSCIIGLFNVVRILSLEDFSIMNIRFGQNIAFVADKIKYVIAGFFAVHYGIFHLVYGVFLLFYAFTLAQRVDIFSILLAGFIFFFDHLFSYRYNRRRDQEKKRSILRLMFFPYARIIPMHIIILFFGFYSVQVSLLLFLGLKTLADVVMHVIEHEW